MSSNCGENEAHCSLNSSKIVSSQVEGEKRKRKKRERVKSGRGGLPDSMRRETKTIAGLGKNKQKKPFLACGTQTTQKSSQKKIVS